MDLLLRHLSLTASHAEAALTAADERATMLQEELDALVVETDHTRQRNRRLAADLGAAKQEQREAVERERRERRAAQQRVAEAEARAEAAIRRAQGREERVRAVLASLRGLGLGAGIEDLDLDFGLDLDQDQEKEKEKEKEKEDSERGGHGSDGGK